MNTNTRQPAQSGAPHLLCAGLEGQFSPCAGCPNALLCGDLGECGGEHTARSTPPPSFEPLPAHAGSVKAVQIVADLLANPYPHDLMAIRREVEREWGDEEVAREEMDTYCTQEAMMEARRKWDAAQNAARDWLSAQGG